MEDIVQYVLVAVLAFICVYFVMKNDYGVCRLCGKKLGSKYYKHEGNLLGSEPSNYSIVLCEKCHKEIMNGVISSMEIVVNKNNEEDK